MPSVFVELKRRHVYRTAAFYAAAGWLLVQIATQVAPYFDLPNWSVRGVIVAIACGFPVALFVSWYWEWSPSRGWQRDLGSFDGERSSASAATDAVPANAIAVLAFVDMSQGKDQEYFSDGLAEELLNLLAQLPQLRVTARTSSFSFKGGNADVATIARSLHVAHVLEGSVRKSGNTLRVTAQLIRGADGTHLWSQTFDRELTDIFAVQDEIARAVVEALKLRLLPEQRLTHRHRSASTAAYDAFLLGQAVLRRNHYEDSQQAVAAFARAIALDPAYAAAHAGLAGATASIADYAADPQRRSALKREALAAAERAVELAPDLADGYVARAQLRYRQSWDWHGAMADLERALALDPQSSEVRLQNALLLQNLGRLDEAIAMARSSVDADPLSAMAWLMLGGTLRAAGDFAAGRVALRRALELNPASSWTRHVLGSLELLDGKPQAALAVVCDGGEAFRQAGVAAAEHCLGHARESQQAFGDGSVQYVRSGGESCSFAGCAAEAAQRTRKLVAAAAPLAARYGPALDRRAPPRGDQVRITVLTGAGSCAGEGRFAFLQRDTAAGPVLAHAIRLLHAHALAAGGSRGAQPAVIWINAAARLRSQTGSVDRREAP